MIYLDNAATSRYIPPCVWHTLQSALHHKANAGRGAHRDSAAMALAIYRTREAIKNLVDNAGAEVVFTKNCTEALNLAIRSLDGGHVVSTVTEHNSVLRPLHEMQLAGQITLTLVAPDDPAKGVSAAAVESALRHNTRLVVVNHVSNVTGVANDVAGIGRVVAARGIPYLVDGAQSVGHLPFSMRHIGCDMVAVPAHKGLHGLQGGGFLVVGRHVRLRPLLYGGTGTDSALLTQPTTWEGLEAGTQNAAGICALGAAIDWTMAHQTKLAAHRAAFGARLQQALGENERLRLYGGEDILSVAVEGMTSSHVADKLDEMGIAVRAGLHCAPLMHRCLGTAKQGLVRFSWDWNNRLSDVERVAEALRSLTKTA